MLESFLGSSWQNHSPLFALANSLPIILLHFAFLLFFIQFSRYNSCAAHAASHFPDFSSLCPRLRLSAHSQLLPDCSAACQLMFPSLFSASCLQRSWWWAQDGHVHLSLSALLSFAALALPFLCATFVALVGSNGLEPSTSRLSGVRSNHLSYEPISVAVSSCHSGLPVFCSPPRLPVSRARRFRFPLTSNASCLRCNRWWR